MKRLTLVFVIALFLLLTSVAFGQGRNLRVGYITVTQWLQTMRGAPILNLGYYDQTYSSNIRDAFKINYTGSGNYLMRLQGDGSNVFTVDKAGNVVFSGTLTAGNVVFDRIALGGSAIDNDRYLNLDVTYSAPASDQYGLFSEVTVAIGSPAIRRVVAVGGTARYTGAGTHDRLFAFFGQAFNDGTGTLNKAYGLPGMVHNTSSGTITQGFGILGWCQNTGSGTINDAWGSGGGVFNTGTGTIDNAYGLEGAVQNTNAGGTIDKAYGLIMYDWSNAGTVNESYGIYMDTSIDVGTIRYALYSSSLSDSYFAGDLGLGTASPDVRNEQKLDIASSADYGGMSLSTWSVDNAEATLLDLKKSGSDTIGSHIAVTDDEGLGLVVFRGSDGVEFLDAAYIRGAVDGAVTGGGADDMPGRLEFWTTPDGSATPVEQFRITADGNFNGTTSKWYYCKYIDAISAAKGGSGATLTLPDGDTLGGYQLNVNTEYLYFNSRACPNWDEASDPMVAVTFEVNVDNTGGLVTDTVDFSLLCYYKGVGETANKTQTATSSTVVGQSAQYKQFVVPLVIDYDIGGGNDVDVRDVFAFRINLDTGASEVDDVIVNFFMYHQQGFKVQMQISEAP